VWFGAAVFGGGCYERTHYRPPVYERVGLESVTLTALKLYETGCHGFNLRRPISRVSVRLIYAYGIRMVPAVTGEVFQVLDAFVEGRLSGISDDFDSLNIRMRQEVRIMPRGDGTGPTGKGPGIGRGQGPCGRRPVQNPDQGSGDQGTGRNLIDKVRDSFGPRKGSGGGKNGA